MSEINASQLTVSRSGRVLLQPTDITLKSGELTVLLGPNGSGKTTLIRSLLRQTDAGGRVLLNGEPVESFSSKERARHIAYLPQSRPLAWPNRVFDIVSLGRYPHAGKTGKLSASDQAVVTVSMASCDIAHLSDRNVDTLSGGELARVHCARVFSTQADFIIADEPVAALDPLHQFKTMELFKAYTQKGGGVLVVLHDINLAAKFADRLIWMRDGAIIADGPPAETLTGAQMRTTFDVAAEINNGNVDVTGPAET